MIPQQRATHFQEMKLFPSKQVFENPLTILNIKSSKESSNSFYNNILEEQKKVLVTVAYDKICTQSQDRYIQLQNNKFKFNLKTYFLYEAALLADLDFLKANLTSTEIKLKANEFGRTLLYTCCRSGYYNCASYLLSIGCDVNSFQKDKSTPLHVAAYYGHEKIVGLLLSYGSSDQFVNLYNMKPSQEGRTPEIKEIIQEASQDKILHLFEDLKLQGLAECMTRSENDEVIRIFKKGENGIPLYSLCKNNSDYAKGYHGTKFANLASIFKIGFKAPGQKTADGKVISIPSEHIPAKQTFNGVQDWGNAIFLTPNVFYASHATYADRITSKNEQYFSVIEALVKQDKFKSYSATTPGEFIDSSLIEMRVHKWEDTFVRDPQEKNLIVYAITFIKAKIVDEGGDQKCTLDKLKEIFDNYTII